MLAMATRPSCPNTVNLMPGPLILLVLFPFQRFAWWPFLCFVKVSQNLGNNISGDICIILLQTRYWLLLGGMCLYLLVQEQTRGKF